MKHRIQWYFTRWLTRSQVAQISPPPSTPKEVAEKLMYVPVTIQVMKEAPGANSDPMLSLRCQNMKVVWIAPYYMEAIVPKGEDPSKKLQKQIDGDCRGPKTGCRDIKTLWHRKDEIVAMDDELVATWQQIFARKSRIIEEIEEVVAKKDRFVATIQTNVTQTPVVVARNCGATSTRGNQDSRNKSKSCYEKRRCHVII